jgi:hypothetical protein
MKTRYKAKEATMKTVKTVRTVEKAISVYSWLILMVFGLAITVPLLAAEPDRDDAQNYGARAQRITSVCDPAIPSPPSLAAAAAIPCATSQVFPPNSISSDWTVDIVWFDPATEKVYLADQNNFGIDIVDARTDTVLGVATGFLGNQAAGRTAKGPNGVLVTTKPHQIWAGDGNGTVRVYNLNADGDTATFLTSIRTGDAQHLGVKRAYELAYDPDDQLILVGNDDDSELFVTFISVSSNKNNIQVKGVIDFKSNCPIGGCSTGGIEQPVYDHGTRLFYLSVPQTTGHPNGEIAVIDPKTMKVVTAFGLTDVNNNPIPCFPQGLAQGPKQQLLVGCGARTSTSFPTRPLVSLVISALDGSLVRQFNQVGGSDEVWYNPGDNTYYLGASSWTSTEVTGGPAAPVVGVIDAGNDADGPEWIQNIPTGANAHSLAAVYLVNAEKKLDRDSRKSNNDDIINKVYVPRRINSSPGETGGIEVIGRIP